MSQDPNEIVFEEISYREPQKMRRPDRDRRWITAAYEVPLPIDLPIFLDLKAADAIERHALRDTSVELGGILLGKEGIDDITGERFVWVTNCLEAKHYENTQASFTYTHESWEEITRERDKTFPDLDIVGWYHTHPDFGIFLSSHDLFIHHNFFAQPLQLAYVVDPIRQTRNFFQWRDGRMEQVGGFFIVGERNDRVRLARLVNDLENIHESAESAAAGGGNGSGFSPRLEAELIAMLSRPNTIHQQHSGSFTDRSQTAALFGLLGAFAGVFGLGAVLWLNQLGSVVYQQSQAIQEMARSTEAASERQRLAFDVALGEKSSEKLSDRFLEQYNRTAKERDDAKKLVADRAAINDTLGARTKELSVQVERLTKKAAALQAQADDAKDVPELRDRLASLERSTDKQARAIEEYEATLETVEGQKAVELRGTYQLTWYAAVFGWLLSIILGVGMIGGYALLRKPDPGPDVPANDNNYPKVQIS